MELTILGPDGRPLSNSFENPSVSLNDPDAWAEMFGTARTDAGVRVNTRSALGYPPYWRAINLISGDVGRLPLNTYRRQPNGGKEKALEHPSYSLLRRKSNRYVAASTFKRTLTWHAMHYGNGTAGIFRNQLGKPVGLLILDPQTTSPLIFEDGLFVTTVIGNRQATIPYEDVFHIKSLSNDGVWGMSVIDLMRQALGMPIAAREYTSRFFGQGSTLSGVLMVPQGFSPDKIENTLKMWNEIATGLSKSHKVALLQDNVKYIPTGVTPKDSETTEILEHEIRTVSAITGVPPHKIGDVTRTSYNSLEQEEQAYLNDALGPWLHAWEEEADAKLLTEREQLTETVFHEFHVDSRMRMDSAARWNSYKAARETGVLSANDILRKENMPTIGPEGDIRYVPANWVALGSANPRVGNSHKQLIGHVLGRKDDIVRDKLRRAAERMSPEDFRGWLGEFWSGHAACLRKDLAPIRRVLESESANSGLHSVWKRTISQFTDGCNAELSAFLDANSVPDARALRLRIDSTVSHRKLTARLVERTERWLTKS